MNKAISSTDLLSKKYNLLEFDNEWYEAFSMPEKSGIWFVWGNSGNGKTSFVLQMVKELSRFGKVLYNSLEEGTSHTMQNAWIRNRVHDCGRRVQLICEDMSQLQERLDRRKSPDIVVIDSFQYTGMNFKDFMDFKKKYPRKLFIFTSQADGKNPSGKSAIRVMYDASLKIWIEGYRAFSKGRYIGPNGGVYTIWEEGAEKYWGTLETN
jgi:GTPase SAR1 family protein